MSDEESIDEPIEQSVDGLENTKGELGEEPTSLEEQRDDLDNLMVELDSDDGSVHEKDMMSMFASVWVKVEVEEDSNPNREINLNSCKAEPSDRSLRVRPNTGTTMYEFDDDDVAKVTSSGRNRKSNKVLKCEQCDYTTSYKNCLKMHILSHHTDTRPYACHYCGYTTKYPTSLSRHILIQHELKNMPQEDQKAAYKCNECDYTSQFKWNLNAHKRKHKLVKQFKCSQCDYCTAYRHNFVKHSKVHTEGIFFKCDKCPFVTRFEGHITRHLAKIHKVVSDKAARCDLCDFSTKVRWRLNTHKQRSKQENMLHCPYCDFQTMYMCESKKHKTTHYNKIYGSPASHKAIQNSSISNAISAMEAPIPIEKMEPPPPPPPPPPPQSRKKGCNQNYKLDPDCVDWNNIQVIESDDKEKPFLCHMCTYTSKFKAAVQRHFQRHHTGNTNRPYKCCNCEFSTKTKDQIALHNKRSLSLHLMVCKTCGFTTYYKCQYVSHQKRLHYNFKCMSCSYTCRLKYDLQKHYATLHLGNGLKCKYCDYTAARKESILCHETIHTGEKPFKCSLCPYMSVRRSLLENHNKRYHTDHTKNVTIISDDKIESLKVSLPPDTFDELEVACESKQ